MSSARARAVLLVVAKSPVPGEAKTRLAPAFGQHGAALLAQAALLDTIDAAVAAADRADAEVVVAITGRLRDAVEPQVLVRALRNVTVVGQRGRRFADRLAAAHAAVGRDRPVLQIGMDTPQAGPDLLGAALSRVCGLGDSEAVLGRARDGGWWAVGLPSGSHAQCLRAVPMSRPDTGERTAEALSRRGLLVGDLPTLCDVDTAADVVRVARLCTGRFAAVSRDVVRVAS